MPLYEYECQSCHKRVEKRQKFSDPEITECPHCCGTLERTITAPAFQFAGGGWYKDGYGSAKPAASEGTSSSEAKPSAASGDSASPAPAASEPAAAAPTQASTPASSASKD